MQTFIYKAKNNQGEIVTGTVKTTSESGAEAILIKHGLVPMEVSGEKKAEFLGDFFAGRVSVKDRAVFSRQLSTMLSAGLPLSKGIGILAKQAKNERLRQVFIEVYKDIEEGYSFSTAISRHPKVFDRVYVSVVGAGETTGKLDVVLNELADQLENDSNFLSKVKSSLYYPGFIFCVLLLAGAFMLIFVVPKIRSLFDQSHKELPILTKILLSLSDFMQNWWWAVLIVIIGLIFAIRYLSQTENGSKMLHSFEVSIPGLKSIFEGVYMYRFTQIMSMLLAAGVPLLDALRISGSVIDNPVYEEGIVSIANQVEKGVSFSSQLLKTNLFPPLIGQMAAVGEETGALDTVLGKVANYYKEATNDLTKAVSSLIEPAILVMVGLGVAFIVFAIYIPIYQINSSAGS